MKQTLYIIIIILTFSRTYAQNAPYPEKTTLGAIRWDAGWVGDVSPISKYSQKQLSPERFRFRTPFFATLHKPDSISFTYTQSIIDEEIAYARNAGIDYWLYNWYPDGSGFDMPLDMHLTSAQKDDVKFSYIFYSSNWQYVKKEMAFTMDRLKESNYMKIDGIPMVFCMHDTWTLADINEMKSEAKKAGIPELYIVIMDWTGEDANQKCSYFGAQATSSYCNWGDGGISYSSFALATEQKWDTYKNSQNAFIPFVTTGWDPRPIIEYYHGLPEADSISISAWYPKPAEDHYVQTATTHEVATHLKAGLDWVKINPAYARPNTVIIYAWNECSEGGFIIPVAEADSLAINYGTQRLDAIKTIMDESFVEGSSEDTMILENSPLVGAIRWDAWVGGKGAWQVGRAVEHSLGPEKFHYRAPFFSIVTGKDSISMDGTTQEIMDQEIAYAKDAGIDYWAYVWYPDDSGLEIARKLHQTSMHSKDVKWCAVLTDFETNVSNNYGAELVADFARENYQKVLGGRPLVYVFSSDLTRAGVDKLRAMTKAKYLKNPYVVVMAFDVGYASDYCNKIGADAISSYAAIGENNRPFAEVIPPRSIANWEAYAARKPIVPWVSTGWNTEPRIEHPVPWGGDYSEADNCQDATAEEIKEFLSYAIDWTISNKSKAAANAIIMYAWNEHDEGFGAICPTLGTDGNPNTERLDSIRSVLMGRMIDTVRITSFQLDVIIKDDETDLPINDVYVQVNGYHEYSDSSGTAHFHKVGDDFILSIEQHHYFPFATMPFSISRDTTITIYLTKKNEILFNILYNNSLGKTRGATVTLGSLTESSDMDGQAIFSVKRGNFEYSINKDSYQTISGNITVQSDTSLLFYLVPVQTHAEAEFQLKDGFTPVRNARIVLNNNYLLTDSLGIALFKQLLVNHLYSYTITKDGYHEQSGAFLLIRDILIDVTLDINTLGEDRITAEKKIQIWPNPVSEILNLRFPQSYINHIFNISDLLGKTIYSGEVNEKEIRISLKDFPTGVYIIRIISDAEDPRMLFIRN